MFASIFALVMFSAVLIWVGSLYRDKTDVVDFHLAGRSAGTIKIAAATFTLIGGGELVTLTALSYAYGAWSLLFFGGVVLGFVILAMLAKQARQNASNSGFLSLSDYFYANFGVAGSIAATVLACISLGALLLIQFVVGGMMLESSTGLPQWACIIGMAAVICAYVWLGGLNGVFATDYMQAVTMFGTIAILVILYAASAGSSESVTVVSSFPPLGDAAVLVLGGVFAVLGGADVWQRVLAARDDAAARKGLLWNSVGWLLFGILIVVLALQIKARFPNADPSDAFMTMLRGGLPNWLAAMATLLIFAAVLSTAEIEIFVISVLINKEITRFRKGKKVSTSGTRLYIIAVTFVGGLFAMFFQQLVSIYFLLLYFMMILGPVALARLLGRGAPTLTVLGIVGGVSVLVALFFLDRMTGAYPLLILCPPLIAFLGRGRTVHPSSGTPSHD